MRIPLIALLALSGSIPALAQQNRISLGLGTLTNSHMRDYSVRDRTETESTQLYILPTIGFYRMLNKKIGVGIEIGYGRGRYTTTETSPAWHPGIPTSMILESRQHTDEIYASPTLFTLVTTTNKRFRFIPGVSLPVSYMVNSLTNNQHRAIYDSTGALYGNGRSEGPGQKSLKIGLMLSGSALCRLAGNLYGGVQLGAGFQYYHNRTDGDLFEIYNEGMPGEARQTTKVEEDQQGVNFQFQPAVVLNYFF